MIKQVIKFPKIKILLTLFTLDDSIVNGEHRFIEFRENEMIWGNYYVVFKHGYGTDKFTECLQPRSNNLPIITSFSESYIILNWRNFTYPQDKIKLYKTGSTFFIFNFKNNSIDHLDNESALDLKHELFVCQQFSFYGTFDYKYPFVLASFDKSHSQFIEIDIDDNLPNPVTNFDWRKDTLITTYISESEEIIVDNTLIDYNSKVESHLYDKEED
jgi:hypothetical protein